MDLRNNEVLLNRHESHALGLPDGVDRLPALELNERWHRAISGVIAAIEQVQNDPTAYEVGVTYAPGVCIAVLGSGYYREKEYEARKRCLDAMGPMVRAISWETLPTPRTKEHEAL